MTVDELHDVLKDRLDLIQKSMDGISTRIRKHDDDITGLKVRDAYVAGGLAVMAVIWEAFRRKIGW